MTSSGESEPLAETGQPVGTRVATAPAKMPSVAMPDAAMLAGRFGALEKLDMRHAPDLWNAFRGHDDLWTYMAYGPFADTNTFANWIAGRAALADPYSYAVIAADGRACGIVTLMEIRPAARVIEVGHIVYAPALKRTALATEVQFLLARAVFETLGYRRYEWKCDALNAASRAAALRYGFTFEGVFRQHMIVKGRNRDTAWHAMLDRDWPAQKAAFERWLSPDNFDGSGRQRASLRALAAPAGP